LDNGVRPEAEVFVKQKLNAALVIIIVTLIATASLAGAEDKIADVDSDTIKNGNDVNYAVTASLGANACSTRPNAVSGEATLEGKTTGGGTHFANGATLAVSAAGTAGITVTGADISLPNPWSHGSLKDFTFSTSVATTVVDGPHTMTLTLTDKADSTKSVTKEFTVNLACGVTAPPSDSTAPSGSIVINDGDAYSMSSSVTLDLTASDAVGVTAYRYANGADCSGATYQSVTSTTSFSSEITSHGLTADEGTRTVCAQFKDDAGNESTVATDTIVVDYTAPTLGDCPSAGPFIVGSGTHSVGPISASDLKDGVDEVSGVDADASTLSGSVNASSVGKKTINFSATDNATNGPTTKSCDYYVAYNFTGFSSPVDNGELTNKAKAGQAIPLKWRLTDADDNPITDLTSAAITTVAFACGLTGTADDVEGYAAGASGLQNLGEGYYQVNWKTPTSYAKSCRIMHLDLGEGITHTALFQFTK
jgi:hypothetical protein